MNIRNCPSCNRKIKYKNNDTYKCGVKNNTKCRAY